MPSAKAIEADDIEGAETVLCGNSEPRVSCFLKLSNRYESWPFLHTKTISIPPRNSIANYITIFRYDKYLGSATVGI